MARLVYERALNVDPDTGRIVSYWPERWGLSDLYKEMVTSGGPIFGAAYMNDPSGLEGNVLKVPWLHFYLPDELERDRKANDIAHGTIHCGIDPTQGGQSGDPDFIGMMAGERIRNRLYLTNYHLTREPVEKQATSIDDWLTLNEPSFTVIEETSSKGFVYTALTTQIHGGSGTIWPITVEKPQDRSASQGGKMTRFLSMGARFQNGTILVPGMLDPTGHIVIDPRWEPFQLQWGGFPSGHDDLLDATYWCQYSAFKVEPAASVSKPPAGKELTFKEQNPDPTGPDLNRTILLDDRGREIRSIGQRRTRPRMRMLR